MSNFISFIGTTDFVLLMFVVSSVLVIHAVLNPTRIKPADTPEHFRHKAWKLNKSMGMLVLGAALGTGGLWTLASHSDEITAWLTALTISQERTRQAPTSVGRGIGTTSSTATTTRNDEKPYVQGWVGSNYPHFSANYDLLPKEEQEAERKNAWGLIKIYHSSNVRSTGLIRLPGRIPEHYTYFAFRVHGDNATVTCFYDHGKPPESYRLNRREESCSGEWMMGFSVTSDMNVNALTEGEHTFRFAFLWMGREPEPKSL